MLQSMAGRLGAVEQFAQRVRGWPPTWKAIDVRCICFRQGGDWRNFLANLRLLSGKDSEYDPMELEYEDERFAVLQEIVDFSALDDLLDGFRHDRLKIRGRDVRLDCPEVGADQPRPYSYVTQLVERTWARQWHFVLGDFQTLVLEGNGQQIGSFIPQEEIDRASAAVTAHEKPFNGLDDVVRSLFYSSYGYQGPGLLANIIVCAPTYAHIETVEEIHGRTYDVSVIGPPSAKPSEFRLNVIMRPASGPPVRRTWPFTKRDAVPDREYLRMTKRVRFVDASFVETFLLRRGQRLDIASFYLATSGTPNPRFAAHLVYDPRGAKLGELLFPSGGRPKPDTFEVGISWLLFFCGFQTVLHGLRGGKVNDEIDCLAFVPLSRNVVAVECTTADLNPEKLIKLANRCSMLRYTLPEFKVLSMAVTPLEELTATETKTAGELGIAVLTRPDIEEVLKRAEANSAPSEIFQFFETKVPGSLDRYPRGPMF